MRPIFRDSERQAGFERDGGAYRPREVAYTHVSIGDHELERVTRQNGGARGRILRRARARFQRA